MVTILPERNEFGSQLGKALGQGFSQSAGQAAQQQYQRGLLHQALQGVRDVGKQQGATPFDIVSSLVELTPLAPGMERALAPLADLLIKQSATEQGTTPEVFNVLKDAGQQVSNLPNFLETGNQRQISNTTTTQPQVDIKDVESKIMEKLGEKYFPTIKEPEKVSPSEGFRPIPPPLPAKPITVAEEQIIRKDLEKAGVKNPDQQTKFIEDLKQRQKDIYSAQKEGYQNISDYQKARKDEDDRFFKEVSPQLSEMYGTMSPDQANIWKGLSRISENAGPDEARFRNTSQMYNQLVYEPLRSFDSLAQPLPFGSLARPGKLQSSLDDSRSLVQDHLKSIDKNFESKGGFIPDSLGSEIKNYLRDAYSTSLVSKDWGTAQAAYAVSNLSDTAKNSIPMAPQELKFSTSVLSPIPVGPSINLGNYKNAQQREEYINKLSKSLFKLKPEDSLILARDKAIQNNYQDEDFNEALRLAVRDGLELSPFQRLERPKLSIPQRIDLDSIMQGKRSVYDYFKAKK